MDKTYIVKVANRDTGRVGYSIPELGVRRQFMSRETKDIPFGELEALSYLPGGIEMLSNYLVIKDEAVIKELLSSVEQEYFYTEEDIKRLMTTGSMDEFLDCLDFAPTGVLELVKQLAVSLPLESISKRNAILNKLNFNVTRAIEIENTKFDGDSAETSKSEGKVRRVTTTTTGASDATPARRVIIKK